MPTNNGGKKTNIKTSFDEYNLFIIKPQTTKSVSLSSISKLFFPWEEYAHILKQRWFILASCFLFFFLLPSPVLNELSF